MTVTVFGASGKVGQLVVAEALQRGYSVTAFVHSHSPFEPNSSLKVVSGDIYDAAAVAQAVKGSDAVISALGSWGTPKKDILTAGMRNIIPAMEAGQGKRIVTLTGHGASAEADGFEPLHEFSRLILKVLAPKILRDGEEHIRLLAASQLDWTAVRSPVMMQRGQSSYELTSKRPLPLAVIRRQAVAECLVDLAETSEYNRQSPFIIRK